MGGLIENFDRRVQPLDSFAPPAFDMTDFEAYERVSGKRELAYATSIGCPYACNYCTDMVVYKRRFNAYAAEHVVAELTELVKRYRIHNVALLDSNFPVDLRRAIAIATGYRRLGSEVLLDLSSVHRLHLPHEPGRGSTTCRQWRALHGFRHRIHLEDRTEADEQAPSACR